MMVDAVMRQLIVRLLYGLLEKCGGMQRLWLEANAVGLDLRHFHRLANQRIETRALFIDNAGQFLASFVVQTASVQQRGCRGALLR